VYFTSVRVGVGKAASMELEGQVAIVVGGAGGMGKGICHLLSTEGALVQIVDINSERCSETQEELCSSGRRPGIFPIDIIRKQDVMGVVNKIISEHGRVDVLVNAAGIVEMGLTENIEEEDWDWMMAVNLKGVLFFCQAVIPVMKEQRGGKIVSIGSWNAKGMGSARADYQASKAGVHALTMAVAKEMASYNVNVNAIAPNVVNTPMCDVLPKERLEEAAMNIPLKRIGTPEDVANAVLFLVSERSSYITGHILDLNGGALMG